MSRIMSTSWGQLPAICLSLVSYLTLRGPAGRVTVSKKRIADGPVLGE